MFADLRLARGFVRLCVTTRTEQAELLERLDDCLSAIESRAADRARRRRPGADPTD